MGEVCSICDDNPRTHEVEVAQEELVQLAGRWVSGRGNIHFIGLEEIKWSSGDSTKWFRRKSPYDGQIDYCTEVCCAHVCAHSGIHARDPPPQVGRLLRKLGGSVATLARSAVGWNPLARMWLCTGGAFGTHVVCVGVIQHGNDSVGNPRRDGNPAGA